MSLVNDILNYFSPDKPQTTEEKLDAILKKQNQSSGFAAPSSKKRRVNLSGATRTQKLSKAAESKALGFDLPQVQSAAQNILKSNNPIVADAIRRVGGRTAAGPRIKLDAAAQSVPSPTPRPRPTPKTRMA